MSQFIYFTPEQIEAAQNTDLVSFLRSRGETLGRSGSEHEWRDGSAKVTVRGNKWFHQYDRVGGKAIDFVCRFFRADFPEAMRILLGSNAGVIQTKPEAKAEENKPFELPEANPDMRRVYAYLLKQRFIDRDIVNYFAHNKMIYEDAEYHNAVFVGYDEKGTPCHAHKRGTCGESSYKGNVSGCDADYSFHYTGTSNRLFVFEAPIDMLSYITLNPTDWQKHSYVALCCTAEHPAMKMLELNPNINSVALCLDHDEAGIKGCVRLARIIRQKYPDCEITRLSAVCKDWNEDLKAQHGAVPIPGEDYEIQEESEVSLCPVSQL